MINRIGIFFSLLLLVSGCSSGLDPLHAPYYNPGGINFENDLEFYKSYNKLSALRKRHIEKSKKTQIKTHTEEELAVYENNLVPGSILVDKHLSKLDDRNNVLSKLDTKIKKKRNPDWFNEYCVENIDLPEDIRALIKDRCENIASGNISILKPKKYDSYLQLNEVNEINEVNKDNKSQRTKKEIAKTIKNSQNSQNSQSQNNSAQVMENVQIEKKDKSIEKSVLIEPVEQGTSQVKRNQRIKRGKKENNQTVDQEGQSLEKKAEVVEESSDKSTEATKPTKATKHSNRFTRKNKKCVAKTTLEINPLPEVKEVKAVPDNNLAVPEPRKE